MKTYRHQAESVKNPLAKKLLHLMSEKETNLAFSADVTRKDLLLDLCEKIGSQICLLKTHLDILDDFDPSLPSTLRRLADKHGFLILEDRKFADIGSTVQSQYRDGYLRIADWADLVTVHGIAGSGTLQALQEVGLAKGRGCLLLAEMSSTGNLLSESYRARVLEMAQDYEDFTLGFIAQKTCLPSFLTFTPGIGMSYSQDKLGQNYKDPFTAVSKNGSDVIIVGRHIYAANDPVEAARTYREQGWKGYLNRS